MAIHSSIFACKIPQTVEPGRLIVHGVTKGQTRLNGQHTHTHLLLGGFPGVAVVKNPPAEAGDTGLLRVGRSLEEETVAHTSIVARAIPCTKEPGELGSVGSQRVRHD